jgi:hypothetical protein
VLRDWTLFWFYGVCFTMMLFSGSLFR